MLSGYRLHGFTLALPYPPTQYLLYQLLRLAELAGSFARVSQSKRGFYAALLLGEVPQEVYQVNCSICHAVSPSVRVPVLLRKSCQARKHKETPTYSHVWLLFSLNPYVSGLFLQEL